MRQLSIERTSHIFPCDQLAGVNIAEAILHTMVDGVGRATSETNVGTAVGTKKTMGHGQIIRVGEMNES